jgi:hypothetical protein
MSLLGGVFKSLINPMSLMQIAMGPAGWASLAMKTIGAQIAMNVLQQIGQKLGLPQPMIDLGQAAFANAAGMPGLARQNMSEAVSGLGFSPRQQGELARAGDDAVNQIVQQAFRNGGGFTDEDGQPIKGTKGKTDFFTMFAKAVGAKLDQGFKDMAAKSDATNWKDSKAVSDFQAEQQKFSFFMTSVSTAIKTVGEALANMARKQ